MAELPAYHWRTHLPGGSDPLPIFNCQWCIASSSGAGDQVVTTTAELKYSTSQSLTNAPDVFKFDPTDPYGVLIRLPGLYLCYSVVRVPSASAGVTRTIYQVAQPLSSGPLAGLGTELGTSYFSIGTGQGASGIGVAPGPSSASKSELAHIATTFLGDSSDPSRFAVILVHSGVDWTISSSAGPSASVLVRLSPSDTAQSIPAP